MDQSPQIQLPTPPEQKKKSLLLLEIGVFEMVFVLMLLVVIFGLLNYMNILNLGKAFPALSFLPKLENNLAAKITPFIPTPTVDGYTDFPYNKPQAEKDVKEFLTETIKKQYLPTFSQEPPLVEHNNIFNYSWTVSPQQVATVTYLYRVQTQKPIRILLSINLGKNSEPMTKEYASSLFSKYFLQMNNSGSLICSNSKTASFCEIFTKGNITSKGIKLSQTVSDKMTRLFACVIYKENPAFATTSTCIEQ